MVDQLQSFVEHADMRIALPDGTELSARAWIPTSSDSTPVPAILEYLPYRKSDGTAARDHIMHPYFAERGYACVRVDARGCGDSDGLFDDEYSEQELQDGVEIVHWIAGQSWCTGRVGMQGISWGGFNGLQIAARCPEPLKAVISIGSTVDRYADDIHYKGGVQLSENIGWAATAMSWFSMPPDPAIVGDKWHKMWLNRLENTPFLASTWLRHPNRDNYWKHGSVCEDYGAIKAAVLTIGGLHDGYRNTMSHLMSNLDAPVKGIAGPWNHKYPHISTIAPAIGYLQEAMR
ncbi:MAG: CocE/NonD family hydrolase, partial [Granulosicoccaceae bacterium]